MRLQQIEPKSHLTHGEYQHRYLLATDIVTICVCILFSIFSFWNSGKMFIYVMDVSIDREIVYGIYFLLIPMGIIVLCRLFNAQQNRFIMFFRIFYVQLLYALFFRECIILSQLMYNGMSFDAIFANMDFALFGYQPSKIFHKKVPDNRLITEIFFFSYFFYYLLITTGWWLLYFKGKYKEAIRSLTIVTCAFYIMYILYVFFPVKGPKYFFPELYQVWYNTFHGYFITDFMKCIFNNMNIGGAAFPSSHVAISFISIVLNFMYNRKLAWVYLPLTIMLYLSTVFIYAHYFVDVAAGIATGIFLYLVIPPTIKKIQPCMIWLEMKLGKLFNMEQLRLP